MLPVVYDLTPCPTPAAALARFADLDGVLLLESVQQHTRFGRYSFLTARPFRRFLIDRAVRGDEPFGPIAAALEPFATATVPGLPPFQGGAAGLLGYDLADAWERLPGPRHDDIHFPALAVGLFDWVIAWDHVASRAWVLSQGYPARETEERRRQAEGRLAWVLERLDGPARIVASPGGTPEIKLAAGHPLAEHPGVSSTFSREGYLRSVERVIEYVRAGDVFQANLSQRLLIRDSRPVVELYESLSRANPAPFAGYFAMDDWAILSSSPERFLRVESGEVETRPIKGTRPRRLDPIEDERQRAELLGSEKDRAENVMIVDLLRNDLSRVCRAGSIDVPELCVLETYETVHHLVSTVVGTLEAGRTAWDLLAASFPGGSVTGAPKVRAMEILRELEPTARGPYCGSLFYVGYDGASDSSILIRTMAVKGGWVQASVGGGITVSSDAAEEYLETLHKAAGLLRALGR